MRFQNSGSIIALVVTLAGCDPSSGGREPESSQPSSARLTTALALPAYLARTKLTLHSASTSPVRVGTQAECLDADATNNAGCVAPGYATVQLSAPPASLEAGAEGTLALSARCTHDATGAVLPVIEGEPQTMTGVCPTGECAVALPWEGADPYLSDSERLVEQHYTCELTGVVKYASRLGPPLQQRASLSGVAWVVQPYERAVEVVATSATVPATETIPVTTSSAPTEEPDSAVLVGAYADTQQSSPEEPTTLEQGTVKVGLSIREDIPLEKGQLPYLASELLEMQPPSTFGGTGLLLGLQPSGALAGAGEAVLATYDEGAKAWHLCDGSSPSDCVPVACPAGSPADMVCGNVFHFSTWTLIVKSGAEAEVPIRLSLGLSGGAPVSWSCGGAPSGRCPTELAAKFVWSLSASPAGPSPSKIAVLVETESGPSSWEALADLDASASASGTVLVNPGAAVVSPDSFTDGTTQLELQNLYTPGWVPIKVSVSALSVCQALYPNKTCPTGVQVTNNTSGTNCSATVLPQNTTSTELIECINLEIIPDVQTGKLSYSAAGNSLLLATSAAFSGSQNLAAKAGSAAVPVTYSWEAGCLDDAAGRAGLLASSDGSLTSTNPKQVTYTTPMGISHAPAVRVSMDTNTTSGYPAVKSRCVSVTNVPNLVVAKSGGNTTSIASAIAAVPAGGLISVKAGTYYESNLSFGGKALTLWAESGSGSTVIDGQGTGPILNFVSGEGRGTVVDGFTIQNGYAADSGAGIYISSAGPTLQNTTFRDCTSGEDGGALYANYDTSYFYKVKFINNKAGIDGGALQLDHSTAVYDHCSFEGNTSNDEGGAVFTWSGHPVFKNGLFRGNEMLNGAAGGAIEVFYSDVELYNTAIVENSGLNGGGIRLEGGGVALLSNVLIANNDASSAGGGIEIYNYPSVTLDHVVVVDNDEASGSRGGLYQSGTGEVIITNSIFSHNRGDELEFHGGTENITNSIVFGDTYSATLGTGCSTSDPGFNAMSQDYVTNDDYHLKTTSIGVNKGTGAKDPDSSTADIGIFGGTYGDDWDLDWDGLETYWWAGSLSAPPSGVSNSGFETAFLP